MNSQNKRKAFLAIGISMAVHVVMLIVALNMVIVGFSFAPREASTLIHVKIDNLQLTSKPEGQELDEITHEPRVTMPELGEPLTTSIQGEEIIPQKSSESSAVEPEVVITTDQSSVEVMVERVFDKGTSRPARARVPQSRMVSAEAILKELVPSSAGSLKENLQVPSSYAEGADAADSGVLSFSVVESDSESRLQGAPKHNLQIPFDTKNVAQDIKAFLAYELLTYEDPADKGKYFKLSVRVEETPVTLPSIPKEIIFLVDSSNSIGEERFEQFKQGLAESFNKLGMEDKFNVMVFKKTMVKFMPKSIPRDLSSITNANQFIAGFKPGSKTDVYEAVLKSIELQEPMKPTYIILLSDGQATQGVTNPQQIINQIAKINKGRVPVFAFGGGIGVDEYLLEFLAFTNRGWAEFSPKEHQINKRFAEMYGHIKDPVLLNLRYYTSGLDEKEIYPKLLPDFFRGSQFVLYGRYSTERSFYLKLLGDAQGEVKEYLITDDISRSAKGDRVIAVDWAFRKVYDLVSKLEYDKDNQTLLKEIKDLSTKFELKTPYIDK